MLHISIIHITHFLKLLELIFNCISISCFQHLADNPIILDHMPIFTNLRRLELAIEEDDEESSVLINAAISKVLQNAPRLDTFSVSLLLHACMSFVF